MTIFALLAFGLAAVVGMGAFIGYVIPLTDRHETPDPRGS